jgi:hypothetical protein
VILHACGAQKKGGSLPGLLAHPCGRAAKALDDAGHTYEIEVAGGYIGAPWTWPSRGRDRALVKELSGKNSVPILVLDDGEVIAGSDQIVRWAAENPPIHLA